MRRFCHVSGQESKRIPIDSSRAIADDDSPVDEPRPIPNYRQPSRDPRSFLDKLDRIIVKLAPAIVFAMVIFIIFSFA
jgi:hypothetical protein